MKLIKQFLLVILLIVFASCKNYYNDTLFWTDNIEIGTDIQTVRESQPVFLEIAWNNPDSIGNALYYEITRIKGNSKNIVDMIHFLVFVDGKYQGRYSIK